MSEEILKAKDDEILELFKMCNEKDKEIERLQKQKEELQTNGLRQETLFKLEIKRLKEENREMKNNIKKAIQKLNKYRNRKDTWGLWCMEYVDNAEIIKMLGGEVKSE